MMTNTLLRNTHTALTGMKMLLVEHGSMMFDNVPGGGASAGAVSIAFLSADSIANFAFLNTEGLKESKDRSGDDRMKGSLAARP